MNRKALILMIGLALSAATGVAKAHVPNVGDKIDRQGQRIDQDIYVVDPKSAKQKYTIKGWHGSNSKLNFKLKSTLPIWFASYSTNALGAAMRKFNQDGGEALWLYLYEMPIGKYVNLPADNEKGWDIAKSKELNISMPLMGNPSVEVAKHVGDTKFCKDGYNGWRSAWDQDEFMVCPQKTKGLFEEGLEARALRAVVKCPTKELAIVYKAGSHYGLKDKKAKVGLTKHDYLMMLKNAQTKGGLAFFDMFLQERTDKAKYPKTKQIGVLDLIEAGFCTVDQSKDWAGSKDP